MRAINRVTGLLSALVMLQSASVCARAQAVERKVNGAPSGSVQFHFAAQQGSGICGDGRTYMRMDGNWWYGSVNDAIRAQPCESGPIRVMLMRDGRDIVRVQTFAGPLYAEPNVTDLGAVSAADAAAYLLSVSAHVDGRPGSDALLPAMLADSAQVTRDLLSLAKDRDRSRDVRRSALSWLVRRRNDRDGLSNAELIRTLSAVAHDDSDIRDVRSQAVSSIARLETQEGLSALETMTQDPTDSWLARRAVEALTSSGDPRSRQYLRSAAERTDLTEEARVAAINGIAGEYSTSKDGAFLRDLYKKVTSDRLRDAIMSGVSNIGGGENRDWMLSIAKDANADARSRRQAIEHAERIGLSAVDLAKLYDTIEDNDVRSSIINQLSQIGTKAASDKLIEIAKGDPYPSNRRRAVQALGRFDDPKVKEALKAMVRTEG